MRGPHRERPSPHSLADLLRAGKRPPWVLQASRGRERRCPLHPSPRRGTVGRRGWSWETGQWPPAPLDLMAIWDVTTKPPFPPSFNWAQTDFSVQWLGPAHPSLLAGTSVLPQ